MNNEDMSDMIKNFAGMINSDNIPDNLKNMINNINSGSNSNNNSNPNSSSNADDANNTSSNSSINPEMLNQFAKMFNNSNQSNDSNSNDNSSSNIDFEMLLKMKTIIEQMNKKQDDPRTNLLLSLKPYLKESRKSKVDQYAKLFSMGKVMEILNPNGGEKNL